MAQTINPVKLKAAAEHLEWVLKQYPESEEVQGLLRSLHPMIDDAKAEKVREPFSRKHVPGAYNFGDGVYTPYKNPSVGAAYAAFVIEMEGGLTDQDKQRIVRMETLRKADKPGAAS
ncbi:MAG TPA: hypothetical protein VN624_02250 [Rhodanobacter sp.]|nr:hypothetical protein [Rhodanobacter sp.]